MSTPFHKVSEWIDAPDWYKEENYSNLSELGVNEFLNLIRIRMFAKYEVIKFGATQKWDRNEKNSYVFLMTREPLGIRQEGYFDDYLFSEERCKGKLKCGVSVGSPTLYGVLETLNRAIRHSNLDMDLESLINKVDKPKNEWSEVEKNIFSLSVNDFLHTFSEGYFNDSFVQVDLTAPTNKIQSDFKELLKFEQQSWSVKKPVFDNEKGMLIDNKVFQYFDLKNFFTLNGVRLTHEQYAHILFNGEFGEDKIRKTVNPLMKKVMTDKYLSWLYHVNQ